jgi:hypothetical protein
LKLYASVYETDWTVSTLIKEFTDLGDKDVIEDEESQVLFKILLDSPSF